MPRPFKSSMRALGGSQSGAGSELGAPEIEKLFNCTVHSRLPNDYFSLHRAVTLGQPVDGHSELGKAITSLAGKLANVNSDAKGKSSEPQAAFARV